MTRDDQIGAFGAALDTVVTRYAHEFDLTCVEMIGCLHLKAHEMCVEAVGEEEAPEEEYD